MNILVLDRDEETQKVFRSIGSENSHTVDFVAEAYVALLRVVKGQLPDIFQILNIPREMHPQRAAGESPEKRILMLGSGRTTNGFARVYLAAKGYRIGPAEAIDKKEEEIFSMVVYDCPPEIPPEKKEIFSLAAKKCTSLPAVFYKAME